MKCLIVGAGPTGLTAALEFARQGILVRIVDAKDAPSPLSRAVGILPKSIEILHRSGVDERIIKESVAYTTLHMFRGKQKLLTLPVPTLSDGKHFMLGLPQNRTEHLMSERLKELGVVVEYGQKVTTVTTSEEGAAVTFSDGTSDTYDWVIAADGVRSTVREALGVEFFGYELDEDWSIADVELGSGYEPVIHTWLLKGNNKERDALIMIPIAEGRVRLVSSTPDSLAAIPMKLDVKNVRRSGVFKISVRQATHYVKGRVLLAGDAAHAHSPVGGRGMNIGIEDAAEAVEAILNNSVSQYEHARKKVAEGVIFSTETARKMLVSNNPFVAVFLRLATWCLEHIPFLREKFFRLAARVE